ncbi:MAG: glycosyltransferase [Burkholderiales bacterium]|jgi:hypothetical protein|nr:glycosyltransferase [Burkholderiales bacterium]
MITLYNPHVDDLFAKPPHFSLLKRKALKKYGFFITEEIARRGKVNVVIDGTISAFIPTKFFIYLPKVLRHLIAAAEFILWRKINGFDHRVSRVALPKAPTDQILFAFSYKAAAEGFSLRRELFLKYRATIFHMSHYFISTSVKATNLAQLKNVCLAGDSDISENNYFKHFFSWYNKKFLVMPFAIEPRFTYLQDFAKRDTRCVATGSFHDLKQEIPVKKYEDYRKKTGSDTYHPIRKEIYKNRIALTDIIESKISPYRSLEKTSKLKQILRHFSISQKQYFSIDLVDLYNNFQFAIVGEEEFAGFPALGAFEAMACGCILIGNPSTYSGLGLLANIHFLTYNGQLEDLINKLKHYRHTDLNILLQISKNGAKFAANYFSQASIYNKWNLELQEIIKY